MLVAEDESDTNWTRMSRFIYMWLQCFYNQKLLKEKTKHVGLNISAEEDCKVSVRTLL